MALKKVVLPVPLGPMMAEIWFTRRPMVASRRATTPPKRTVSDLASRARPSVMRRQLGLLAFLTGHRWGRAVALPGRRRSLGRHGLLGLLLLDLLLPVLVPHFSVTSCVSDPGGQLMVAG